MFTWLLISSNINTDVAKESRVHVDDMLLIIMHQGSHARSVWIGSSSMSAFGWNGTRPHLHAVFVGGLFVFLSHMFPDEYSRSSNIRHNLLDRDVRAA